MGRSSNYLSPPAFWERHRIQATYGGAMLLIAALALMHFGLQRWVYVAESEIATVMFMLFDQSYRIQRCGLLVELVRAGDGDHQNHREELSVLIAEMSDTHDEWMGLPGVTQPVFDQEMRDFLKSVEASQPPLTIRESITVLAATLNKTIAHYKTREFELKQMELLFNTVDLGVILGSLAGLFVFVFRPLEQHIRREQNALRESEQRLRSVTHNYPHGTIFMFDHDLRYLLAEGMGLREMGFNPDQLEGKTLFESFPPEVVKMVEEIYWRTLAGEQLTGELLYQEQFWLLYRTQPITNGDGKISAGLIVLLDITARKKAEAAAIEQQRLAMALQKEHEMSQLKTQLMMRISHEFRTPLAVIQSSYDLLKRYSARMTEARREEHEEAIQKSIRQITAMLDAIAFIVKDQYAAHPPTLIKISLHLMCETVLNRFRKAYPEREFTVSGKAPSFFSNREMIDMMLEHLVSNAVKYSGGAVKVIISAEGEQVVLQVHDEGKGIPAAEQTQIFETFYRGSNAGNIPGIGVGLSIVKMMAQTLRGDVTCEMDETTIFTVKLPMYEK